MVPRAQPTRVVVWDCFEGPVKTLDVGGIRDAHGRYYNERGALYPLVHQFRPTRQSRFVAALARTFPPRTTDPATTDAHYPAVAWKARLYELPLQRTPFLWDDKRRMERLATQIRTSGLPNPADPARPLPLPMPPCAPAAQQYGACASRDERSGAVRGGAWEGMASEGFVVGAPHPAQQPQREVRGGLGILPVP